MNEFSKKPKFLTYPADKMENYLYKYVTSYEGKTSKYIKNYFGWDELDSKNIKNIYSGKAFRPSICILVCTSFSGTLEMALPPSISVELVHNFSLIHDDIEDNDKVRRHKPTLWTIWGIPKAIITGNSILVLGNKVLNNMTKNGSTEKDLFLSQRILTESYLKMMEGQFLDISFEKEKNISLEKYLKMISLKTGALIECSVTLGAIASKKDMDNFLYNLVSTFGREIGLLFQIRDDLLGVWGTDRTGKPVGADIKRKKKSLPIILSLSSKNKSASKKINKILSKQGLEEEDVNDIMDIMDVLKIKEKCEEISKNYQQSIESTIEKLPIEKDQKLIFNEISEFLISREN
tara:strand:- start:5300 stop:6343 length:1044 start_codon:yes stop_codon:yes gene_type:complete